MSLARSLASDTEFTVALEKAGGYYFSTGGSEMIIDGRIKVKQGEIASFIPTSSVDEAPRVAFKDGSEEHYDVVVFATGYTGFPDTIRATVGERYADTFNPVWGLDEEGEIRGVCRESGIPNAYFLVGNLSACRMSSKVLALTIAAERLGVFGERCESLRSLSLFAGVIAHSLSCTPLCVSPAAVPISTYRPLLAAPLPCTLLAHVG